MVKHIFSLALLALVSATPVPDVEGFPDARELALGKGGLGGAKGLGKGLGGGKGLRLGSNQLPSHKRADIDP